MKRKFFTILSLSILLAFLTENIYCQTGSAINFQNATFNSHGDFIYCG